MQQTEKYKLNLIERTDTFSPEALNQNTQKVEEVLAAETAALDARVTVVEAKKVVTGSYTGNGDMYDGQTINLGFTPVAVLVEFIPQNSSIASTYILTARNTLPGNSLAKSALEIVEGGFRAGSPYMTSYNWNSSGVTYHFLALA